jgi:GNAT superfamily N-acetyltransferase
VGRIVGIINDKHNQFHDEKIGFFGFFESVHDQSVANALLDEVARWAKSKGMSAVRGPVSPSTNYECGLLVEGFDDPPAVNMTYNPTYYPDLFEKWGLAKAKDLYAYLIKGDAKFSDRLMAHAERLKKKGAVSFRPVRLSKFDQEVELIQEIYNDAWEKNWGFVPMDSEEFRHMAKDMKTFVDPELCLIAEVRGQAVGFALTMPDVNQAIKKVPDGKLLPTGLLKLLWHTKGPGRKKTIDRCRIITLGVRKAHMELGVGPMLYSEYLKRCVQLGYKTGEASWILEDNRPMNKALELMRAQRSKVYRIYDRPLA